MTALGSGRCFGNGRGTYFADPAPGREDDRAQHHEHAEQLKRARALAEMIAPRISEPAGG
jgi:hypothetical protein